MRKRICAVVLSAIMLLSISSIMFLLYFRPSIRHDSMQAETETDVHIDKLKYLNRTLSSIHAEMKTLKQQHDVFMTFKLLQEKESSPLYSSSTSSPLSFRHARAAVHRISPSASSSLSIDFESNQKAQTQSQILLSPSSPIFTAPPSEPAYKNGLYRNSRGRKMFALIFTMDSISSYESSSLKGGAAGEIRVRKSLESAFTYFDVSVTVVRSDEEFNRYSSSTMAKFDIIIVDSWTWAAPGWVPKNQLLGRESKIYVLDYFGCTKMRGKGLNIPMTRVLTTFGSNGNTFLGFSAESFGDSLSGSVSNSNGNSNSQKINRGIIWGKDTKHFEGKQELLQFVAGFAPLVSSATSKVFDIANIEWKGHLTHDAWENLLGSSKFLLGLGDPLMGPSVIDAISRGCMYLNPVFEKSFTRPQTGLSYSSQHPYAMHEPSLSSYVCSFSMNDRTQLKSCIDKALSSNLPAVIPKDFTRINYLERVKAIFSL